MAALAPAFESGVEVGEADLGEKAEIAKIDAEDGRASGGKYACGSEQGSVATENDDQFGLCGGHFATIDGFGAGGVGSAFKIEKRLEAVLAQPVDEVGQKPVEFFLVGLANYGDANHAVKCNGLGLRTIKRRQAGGRKAETRDCLQRR